MNDSEKVGRARPGPHERELAEWHDWDHEVGAPTIAQAFAALVQDSAVTGATYHCATTPLIIAWFLGDEVNVPLYDKSDFPPTQWAEPLDHYRPSLVARLEALAVDFNAPPFGPRWQIEDSHRFRDL